MRFAEVQGLLVEKFGNITAYEAKRILEQAFPDSVNERTTYVCGVKPSHVVPSTPGSSALPPVLPPALEPSSSHPATDHESLRRENAELKQRVSDLEAELESLRQSSIQLAVIESQADHLISCTSISDGPDTLEHLQSFSVPTILEDVKREAPDMLRLFQIMGNSERNTSDGDIGLAVEQLKVLVSICTLLNTRCV